ncbi:replication protein C [Roseibium sp. TrichSKD4]|uniref:plasmid replication protein RepC n=1 Tax=Roseibium sp. TrichSKD4 TaxID=744980 RepID=UPI0001E56F38|nr:plasmid replication protein RepC [Roseibium sp. TrichSKD4]EFO31315.1 replication protein C [Roseibium sp. TrichSKD4]
MSIAAKFRTINQQIVASQALAAQKCQANTTKTEAARVIKSACPALHITRGRYQALDLLLGATRSGDWVDDREPIATLSNAYLANALACSERTVSRLLKGLVEAGILAYRDSPTGRRFRSKNGQEVYGLSFAPARQRLDELRVLAQEHRAKLASDRAAKRAVEQALRSLEDLRIQAENGGVDFTRIEADALAIKDMAADRATKAEALSILLEGAWTEVDQALHKGQKMSWSGDKTDTHLHPTNPETHVSSSERTCANAQDIRNSSNIASGNEMALEKEPCGGGSSEQEQIPLSRDERGKTSVSGINFQLVRTALCQTRPNFNIELDRWSDLLMAADTIRAGIGLSPSAYRLGAANHGDHVAALCAAIIAEKFLRGANISSPGGYFRGMMAAAERGELRLDKTLFGLINSSCAMN